MSVEEVIRSKVGQQLRLTIEGRSVNSSVVVKVVNADTSLKGLTVSNQRVEIKFNTIRDVTTLSGERLFDVFG